MQYLEFEFNTEDDLRETVKKMWDGLGISGEMAIKPLADGRWRLEIASEKDVRDTTLEKFAPFRLEKGE